MRHSKRSNIIKLFHLDEESLYLKYNNIYILKQIDAIVDCRPR